MLLVAAALAAPLSPATAQGSAFTFDISAALASERMLLRVPGCDGDCAAIRRESWQGGEVGLWFTRNFGLYGGAAHEAESTAAATYSGDGFRVYGGAKGGFRASHAVALDAWATITHTETAFVGTEDGDANSADLSSDAAKRNQFEGGLVARFGAEDGGVDAWVGVEGMPYSLDLTNLVQGEALVRMRPAIPVAAVVGFRMISNPLGPPWSERGRISAGISGSVGYRIGVSGWVTASL